MNWDAIGAAGEIIGAIAVVISISYLAVQIRNQIQESRLTATRELSRDYRHVIETMTGDEELFDTYLRAMKNYNDLPDRERIRIHMRLFSPLFGVLEQQFLHQTQGKIDPVFLDSIKSRMSEVGRSPGIRMWWERNRNIYGIAFQNYVDQIYMDKSYND